MGQMIHARMRGTEFVYRVYSTITDAYYTPEMTESQMVRWLIENELESRISRMGYELEGRFARARAQGTSRYGCSQDLNGPWMKQRNWEEGEDCCDEDAEQYLYDRKAVVNLQDSAEKSFEVDGKHVRVTFRVKLVDTLD